VDLMQVLRLSGSAETATPRTARMRSLLVAIEVALVVVLLGGSDVDAAHAGDPLRSRSGFRADGVIAVRLISSRTRAMSPRRHHRFHRAARRFREGHGGVAQAAASWPFDYTGPGWTPNITLPDRPFAPGTEPAANAAAVTRSTSRRWASAGARPDVRSRGDGGRPVSVIVNQSFVNRFFPNEDPSANG
jgi:hypothetical protein